MGRTDITWVQRDSVEYLRISFTDTFTFDDAKQASQEWKNQFQAKPGQRIKVIFNALKMDNYEPAARSVWQKTISELSEQIDSIWLVTDSKLIAAGAKIMSILTSFRINVVLCEDKIYETNAELAEIENMQILSDCLV